MSTYNAFVQANINVVKVFITKKVRSNGGSVLAPYQISRGTLPSIAYEKGAGDVLVTNLSLGSLVIDAETVVGELAEAIVANNAEWESGDQLTFFYGRQSVDAVTETPRAVIVGTKVVLDVADSTPLWEITGSLGFSSVAVSGGYVLGMNRSIVDGAAAWIHSRESQGGEDLRVGTQSLFVDSSVLAQWQGDSAFDASADSYGGINSQSVYLDPKAIRRRGVSQQVSSPVEWETISGSTVQGSGASGSGASGSGSETGGQSSSSGNGNEGSGGSGSSTGSETVTVAAPVFSGETQFTESTQVSMSGPAGASIFYTVDGSTPTDQSLEYEEPITLSATTTLKAIAIKDGVSSSVTSRTYTKVEAGGGGEDEPGGDDH